MLSVVGELGSDDAHIYRLLLLMVLCLSLAIWLSLVFAHLVESLFRVCLFCLWVASGLLVDLWPCL